MTPKVAVALLVSSLALTLAACAGVASREGEAHATTLTITSVAPWPGMMVGNETVVVAELAYRIQNFVPGEYFVIAQVEMENGATGDGSFPDEQYPVLLAPQGHIHFSLRLAYLLEEQGFKEPLTVWFYLNHGTLRQSEIVTKAGPVTYPRQ